MRRVPIDSAALPQPGAASGTFSLPEQAVHYLATVLRLAPGEHVELFDGAGRSIEVALRSVTSTEVLVEIIADRSDEQLGESALQITLYQAMPKGERWDWVLEKATELGVSRIVPLQTARTVVSVPAAKLASRIERWQKIAAGAARQSKRTLVPRIEAPASVASALAKADEDFGLVAHTRTGCPTLTQAVVNKEYSCSASFGIWIGPEGGFEDSELAILLEHGVKECSLGPRILRSETAGIVAVALIQAARGDMA
ncbi:MAG: 16S rRNA (uracil(1498)-N(3))-methyltransferase [Bradymonadaceae bacterium]|nr:16S rRNA (uracil(1498)-N(3))-methyltransferase [Lujinxingiaceae bacterium]